MAWQLSPGVAFREVGHHLIFFDLQTDRYLSLRGADREVFQAMRDGRDVDSRHAARLVGAGLVIGAAQSNLEQASVIVPHDDLSAFGDDDRPPIGGVARTSLSLAWSKWAARRSRIAQTIAAIRRRKCKLVGELDPDAVLETAVLFTACRPLVPIARRCLIDSLALMDILLAKKLSATLVFGVRADPFSAHCWVQSERQILTCAADDALGFAPIMVV